MAKFNNTYTKELNAKSHLSDTPVSINTKITIKLSMKFPSRDVKINENRENLYSTQQGYATQDFIYIFHDYIIKVSKSVSFCIH